MKENKLIADFMGIENDNAKMRGHLYECPVTAEYVSHLEYHTSWDWLMPVVEKMNTTELWDEYDISHLATYLVSVDINATYNTVVEFIKEYNKNKQR